MPSPHTSGQVSGWSRHGAAAVSGQYEQDVEQQLIGPQGSQKTAAQKAIGDEGKAILANFSNTVSDNGSLGILMRHGPPDIAAKRGVPYGVDICEFSKSAAITDIWTETASLFAPPRGTRRYRPGITSELS